MAHGVQYHVDVETPPKAIGHAICDSLHHDRDPLSLVDRKVSDSVTPVMVDAAQHELCPDTLGIPHKPLPEREREQPIGGV